MITVLSTINSIHNRKNIIQSLISNRIIGYDFDGVLHTNVGNYNDKGERELTQLNFDNMIPFTQIIDQIKNQMATGNKVFIITARPYDSQFQIKQFLDKQGLSQIDLDNIYCTDGLDKTTILGKLKVNEFYDDSCLRIMEIRTSKNNNFLPHLEKLYLVYPETQNFILITHMNILDKCPSLYFPSYDSYALYLLPDTLANNTFIQLTEYDQYSGNQIYDILKLLSNTSDFIGAKLWTISNKAIDLSDVVIGSYEIDIDSSTLNKLSNILSNSNIKTTNLKITYPIDKFPNNINNTTWSLFIVKRSHTGNSLLLEYTKLPMHDITFSSLVIPKQQIISKPIKVLSYNVSWEAMTGKWPICDKYQNKDYTICLHNVITFINDNKPYDFIGLQEVADWNNFSSQINLPNMTCIYHTYDVNVAQMATYYDNNKYHLDDDMSIINTFMANRGRLLTILFFKEQICLINVNAHHGKDILNFDQYLEDTLKSTDGNRLSGTRQVPCLVYTKSTLLPYPLSTGIIQTIKNKLKTYEIIILGDMNYDFPIVTTHIILSNPYFNTPRILNGLNTTASCCDTQLQGNVTHPADHILSTNKNITSVTKKIQMASDHLPVIAHIQQ